MSCAEKPCPFQQHSECTTLCMASEASVGAVGIGRVLGLLACCEYSVGMLSVMMSLASASVECGSVGSACGSLFVW